MAIIVHLEQRPRSFLKEIVNSYNCRAWTDLKVNNGKFDSNFPKFEWTVTFNVINQVKHFKCNSSHRNSFWAFSIKMLHGLLPLGPILKQRHPTWYKDFTCSLCPNQEDETLLHLQNCSGLIMLWNHLWTDLDTYISSLWDDWTVDLGPIERQKCLHLILGNSSTSPQFLSFKESVLELKFGLSVFNSFKQILQVSSSKLRILCTKILVKFIQIFRKSIWNERCTSVIAWERYHNISQRIKTAVNKRKPRYVNQQSTYNQTDDPEILDDPYISPPLKPPIETKRDKFKRI